MSDILVTFSSLSIILLLWGLLQDLTLIELLYSRWMSKNQKGVLTITYMVMWEVDYLIRMTLEVSLVKKENTYSPWAKYMPRADDLLIF